MIDVLKSQLITNIVNKSLNASDTNLTGYGDQVARWTLLDGDKLMLESDEDYKEFCIKWKKPVVNEINKLALVAAGFMKGESKKKSATMKEAPTENTPKK